jgi:hypothetical protein
MLGGLAEQGSKLRLEISRIKLNMFSGKLTGNTDGHGYPRIHMDKFNLNSDILYPFLSVYIRVHTRRADNHDPVRKSSGEDRSDR